MLSRNEALVAYFRRKRQLEDRAIKEKRETKLKLDMETKKKMDVTTKTFLKKNHQALL